MIVNCQHIHSRVYIVAFFLASSDFEAPFAPCRNFPHGWAEIWAAFALHFFRPAVSSLMQRFTNFSEKRGMEKKILVAIPIFDKMLMLDALGPYEILQVIPTLDVVFVSHKPGLISDRLGYLSIYATHSFEDVPYPDIVLVPGGMGISMLYDDEIFNSWLRKAHEKTLYTTSVCTGALLLGSAGLLKGLTATTHWAYLAELRKYGATVSESRVVQDGKVITAGGVSSGLDMALKLAALITDETLAKAIQLSVEYDPQPPFDAGSLAKAGPEIEEKARSLMAASRKEAYDLMAAKNTSSH